MPGALIDPVGADEFARLLGDFASFLSVDGPIALAVSGGPDSMALAFCAKRWAKSEIVALIVDHALRAESAAEAAQVKISLEQMGVPAEILHWQHDPITARLHEKAREARYRLLSEACRRHGAKNLLLAHHRDDQAETILMRLAKGSGVEGLAGMEAQTMREGICFLRPLLSLPKERLIVTCQAAHIPFVTDSSNKQEKFARGRLRQIMPLLAREGMTVENLLILGTRAKDAKNALEHYTKNLLRSAAQNEIGGSIRIDRTLLCEAPRAIGLRALSSCLRYIHDEGHPPEYAALSSLFDVIAEEAVEATRTLYGCIAAMTPNHITLLREPSAATELLPLRIGKTVLWDGRWLVTAQEQDPARRLAIRALGNPPHDLIDRLAPDLRRQIPQGRIRASLPALWKDREIVALPSFDGKTPLHIAYRKQTFP